MPVLSSPTKQQQPADANMESWDDDDFDLEGDNLTFRSASTNTNNPTSCRRDSTSSHLSLRSEQDSLFGEERHVHLPGDEKSTLDAIQAAEKAGIPLPRNVAPSALTGGTIKRLGGRKIRKIIQDEDWENDLELPDSSQMLRIISQDNADFPQSLRSVSSSSQQPSPVKVAHAAQPTAICRDQADLTQDTTSALSAVINVESFKDDGGNEGGDKDKNMGYSGDTIKVSRGRKMPNPVSLITPPTPRKNEKTGDAEEDFDADLELPSDGKLRLSTRREIPKTPSHVDDLDWGEGSLGTRYGGTRREGRSNRSSSASALSPSVSSSFTAESEDETFEGLVLPAGPVNFEDRLEHRRKSNSPERIFKDSSAPSQMQASSQAQAAPQMPQLAEADKTDFLDGLEIGDGNAFDSRKLSFHRNIKIKETQPASPARPKTAVCLTFSNKPSASGRIPRLSHERAHSTSLAPVSESGGPIPPTSRTSRLGHTGHASVPNVATSAAGQTHLPSTPRRREVGAKSSLSSLRTEPTTTSAQLLKQKRSLPAIKSLNSPGKPLTSSRPDRPPSRSENSRCQSILRPKTPVHRRPATNESPAPGLNRRPPLPFLPAGASQSQSQHVSSKMPRQPRRHDPDIAIDLRPTSRAISRTTMRSPSPQRYRVNAGTWERLSKPKIKKHFGDGHELDDLDDLPTSKESEMRFMRQPISSSAKVTMRNKKFQNILPDRTNSPSPSIPTPTSAGFGTPRFARDTKASRIARETSLAHKGPPSSGPLVPVTAQRAANLSTKTSVHSHHHNTSTSSMRSKKGTKRPPQLKPHLIANLNTGKESKMVNGMFYNPETYRWEGNENVLYAFDTAVSTPTNTKALSQAREKETTAITPRPALITNISTTKGVQVVGGMVFDPQNMCWLKIGSSSAGKADSNDPLGQADTFDDDDVFKDIPDLDDNATDENVPHGGRVSDIQDEWLVGEEFDVGPEFVKRQREEEDRWRKKCDKWVGRVPRDQEAWRWTIRELVSQFDELPI